MNSRDYWHDREIEALQHYITDEEEYSHHIEKIYMNMLDNVQKEISSFYGKYAAAEGITIAEAKKKISKADMDALARDAERYTKAAARDRKLNGGQTDYTAGYFSKEANDRMRLYNATMKINRLEMLKANIGRHLIKGSAELDEYMGEILQGRTVEELERMAGILGESVKDNAKAAHSIVNASFHNATFSNRIWLYNDVMKADIDKLIQQGMIQGKNARVLAKDLRKYYTGSPKLKNGKNGAIYSAERLMRTELARVQIGAQEKALKANGFDMYQFNVNGGCCPDCEQAAKKDNGYGPGVYLLEDLQYGYNAPPLHPHCRCSISAYSDRKVYDAWFDYMDKTGQEISWQDFKRGKQESGYLSKTARHGTNDVDAEYIKSDKFRNKFSKLTNNSAVNDAIRKYADAMLTHRAGTDGEDLYIIDSKTGKLLLRKFGSRDLGVEVTAQELEEIAKQCQGQMIGIHNHPTNLPPTGSDFTASGWRGYGFGIVVTHDGKVHKYKHGSNPFLPSLIDNRIP